MELKDTIEMMTSSDYKERFKAEYYQIKTRCEKLNSIIVKHYAKTMDFTLSCNIALLVEQKRYMSEYMRCLEIRAEVEGIQL